MRHSDALWALQPVTAQGACLHLQGTGHQRSSEGQQEEEEHVPWEVLQSTINRAAEARPVTAAATEGRSRDTLWQGPKRSVCTPGCARVSAGELEEPKRLCPGAQAQHYWELA